MKTTTQKISDYLNGQKILILGYGREGRSALDFIRRNLPDVEVAVADQNPIEIDDITTFSGEDYLSHVADYDLVIKSPGVVIKDYLDTEQQAKITCTTDLFIRFCDNPIIGITGTKGKSTTSSLVYHILTHCGREAVLVGNIGKPCFDFIDQLTPDTVVVMELSCHQLEFATVSPHIAILLNLYEEHLDHYLSADDYYHAKKNIFHFQQAGDLLLYGDIFQHCSQAEFDASPSIKLDIYKDIDIDPSSIETHLIGEHFRYDIMAAVRACEELGVDRQAAIASVKDFHGLPHRLEYVGTYQKIKFYNDSIATAQEAAISGIKGVGDVDTIILGGMDRGLDYHVLVDFIRHSQIHNVLLLPNTADSMKRIFDEAPYMQSIVYVPDMEAAVKLAYQVTAENHSCLLSPAAASYGFYKNFEERGNHFRELVAKYGA